MIMRVFGRIRYLREKKLCCFYNVKKKNNSAYSHIFRDSLDMQMSYYDNNFTFGEFN